MNRTISDARRLYIDSNAIIYLVEGVPEFRDAVIRLFQHADDCGKSLITSEITIAECLHGAYRKGSEALAEEYREIFHEIGPFHLVPVERDVLELAAIIGARQKLKLIDAIHAASATAAECDVFVTNDKGIKSTDILTVVPLLEVSPSQERRPIGPTTRRD